MTLTNLADNLARQRAAFLRDAAPDLARRRSDLGALRRAIQSRRAPTEAVIDADFVHRSRHGTAMMEILPTLRGIAYLARNLRRFMRPERRHVDWGFRFAHARVEYQPLGVVGIVSPWNYPLPPAMMSLATALAAGNRAMIKPSEFTPRTSQLISDMLAAVFSAEKAPVTLKLGGKSPMIVAPGGATEANVSSIAFGKLANAGQTCVAADYALVHQKDLSAFCAAFDSAVSHMYPEGPSGQDRVATSMRGISTA